MCSKAIRAPIPEPVEPIHLPLNGANLAGTFASGFVIEMSGGQGAPLLEARPEVATNTNMSRIKVVVILFIKYLPFFSKILQINIFKTTSNNPAASSGNIFKHNWFDFGVD